MENIEQIASTYKLFSDPTRLKILKLLSESKALCVNALTRNLGVTQSAVSQHLRLLKQAGIVKSERMGYHIHYSLDHKKLKEFKGLVAENLGSEF